MNAATRDLGGIDLNLLPKFRALYRCRSVSHAARDLHLTQSAVSNALARLRWLFADDLFVRTPTGMEPTALAHALAEPIDRALSNLESQFRDVAGFDPERSVRAFTIGITPFAEAWLAPRLLPLLQTTAPQIVLKTVPLAQSDLVPGLRAGRYDVAVGNKTAFGEGERHIALRVDEVLLMARRDHPVLQHRPLTAEALASCSRAEADEPGAIDDDAARVRFRTVNVLALPWVLARTDLVAFVPAWFGARYAGAGVTVVPVQNVAIAATTQLIWHENAETDAGHAWLREVIVRAAGEASRDDTRGAD